MNRGSDRETERMGEFRGATVSVIMVMNVTRRALIKRRSCPPERNPDSVFPVGVESKDLLMKGKILFRELRRY